MKTQTPAPARPQTASGARLRRLAVVGLAAPVLALSALSACSSEAPVTADPTASAAAGTTPPTTSSAPTTSTDAPTTSATPDAKQSTTRVKTVITDPALGHTITSSAVTRNMLWPSGNPVASQSFEIVGVWVTLKAGSRYSASIDPSMLSLIATSPQQQVAPTAEFTKRWGATVLQPAKRGQTSSGWVFFKVNRGTSTSLRLAFNRPAYQVSTTDKKIEAHTFWAQLTR